MMTQTFICGCGHSGTSLLANMFAANPHVFIPQVETELFLRPHPGRSLVKLEANALFHGKRHLVEKTPRHIERLELIRKFLPRARIVMMVRDGRDVAASFLRRYGTVSQGVERWIRSNEIILSEVDAADTILLRYEDLISRAEQKLREICDFAHVPFSEEMLRYHRTERLWFGNTAVETGTGADGVEHRKLRNWQINQPIFDGSGKWMTAFPEGPPEALLTGRGAELMRAFGYDPQEQISGLPLKAPTSL